MPRRMSEGREREYGELRAFMGFWFTYLHRVDASSPGHPVNVLQRIEEAHGKSRAMEGLRQAINDVVEEVTDFPLDTVREMDRVLGSVGLVSISELRRRYSAQYRRILKHGRIRNDTEYYLVAGVLADTASSVPAVERVTLENMSAAYGGST
jgi:hypothetical protein